MKRILLPLLLLCTLLPAATSKQDDKTGLIWQDNKDVAQLEMGYTKAVDYCQKLTVDGFTDWRLPTVRELHTIVDLKRDRPSLKKGFDIKADERFWTITPFAKDPQKSAWRISFSYGEIEAFQKGREYHVRCVRDIKTKK